MSNAAISKMTERTVRSREMAALRLLYGLFPFGAEVTLPTGETAVIKPFVEPQMRDGAAEFAFDIQAADGSWHLEFHVLNTGWGGTPCAEMPPAD